MNILFIILIVVVSIIVLLLISGLFIKKTFFIERTIVIQKNKQEVFNYIKFLKNAEQYNKWMMTDPDMRKILTGMDGTKGFTYAWDSNNKNVGAGAQKIIDIQENDRIDYEIRFERPFKSIAYSSLICSAVSADQTEVTWTFHGPVKYPVNILHALLNLAQVLGKDLDTSLHNLKKNLKKIITSADVNVPTNLNL
jgi:uncharacterized protein YndB with AHSA1/START domain